MDTTLGKRALNKQQTRRTIRAAAMTLFYERGFDQVTTTEVADAAKVSPATVFNYFATKEDLFFGQEKQLERELVAVVTTCPGGESLLARLQQHVLHELTAGRATSNPAAVRPFHQQVVRSASLQAHEHDMYVRREAVLADALADAIGPDADPLQPRLAAALYIAAGEGNRRGAATTARPPERTAGAEVDRPVRRKRLPWSRRRPRSAPGRGAVRPHRRAKPGQPSAATRSGTVAAGPCPAAGRELARPPAPASTSEDPGLTSRPRRRPSAGQARVRQPAPYIQSRVRSGRGATEQPNAVGDGAVALTPRFWGAVAVTAVAAGLFGVLMMLVLRTVEHQAYGYHHGDFESGVMQAGDSRLLVVITAGGLVTGIGWYVVRRLLHSRNSDLDDTLWAGEAVLSMRRSLASSTLSEIAVGVGASLGRESAPKLLGAASGSLVARWAKLSPHQRRLLVACGGGAGMAAIYNVPLGGALLTAEVLYGSLTLSVVLPALACSGIATMVAWIYLPNQFTYLHIPTYQVTASLTVWSVPAGLLIGVVSVGYVRLIGVVSARRLTGWRVAVAPALVFALLGCVALHYPQLLGNGRDMAGPEFVGAGTIGVLLVLAILKPLVTVACMGSGATGGLLTPTFATGAALGGFLGLAWAHMWGGVPLGAFALVGAAAMLSAGLQAPLTGLVLMLELTGTTNGLIVPMLVATVLATTVARYLDGYSIYSVRLPAVAATLTEE